MWSGNTFSSCLCPQPSAVFRTAQSSAHSMCVYSWAPQICYVTLSFCFHVFFLGVPADFKVDALTTPSYIKHVFSFMGVIAIETLEIQIYGMKFLMQGYGSDQFKLNWSVIPSGMRCDTSVFPLKARSQCLLVFVHIWGLQHIKPSELRWRNNWNEQETLTP